VIANKQLNLAIYKVLSKADTLLTVRQIRDRLRIQGKLCAADRIKTLLESNELDYFPVKTSAKITRWQLGHRKLLPVIAKEESLVWFVRRFFLARNNEPARGWAVARGVLALGYQCVSPDPSMVIQSDLARYARKSLFGIERVSRATYRLAAQEIKPPEVFRPIREDSHSLIGKESFQVAR
jgi:hypothetical protein